MWYCQALKAKGARRNQLLKFILSSDEIISERKWNKSNKINPCDSVSRDLDANHINRLRDTQHDIGEAYSLINWKWPIYVWIEEHVLLCYSYKHLCQQILASKQLLAGGLTEHTTQMGPHKNRNTNRVNNSFINTMKNYRLNKHTPQVQKVQQWDHVYRSQKWTQTQLCVMCKASYLRKTQLQSMCYRTLYTHIWIVSHVRIVIEHKTYD